MPKESQRYWKKIEKGKKKKKRLERLRKLRNEQLDFKKKQFGFSWSMLQKTSAKDSGKPVGRYG